MSTKISDTNMYKWKSDYTSSDTNTPKDNEKIWKADSAATDVVSTNVATEDNLGAQLRNIKSVVKGDMSDKSIEKWQLTNPTYLGQSSDYLDKIQVDGNFSGSALFSAGTKIFFTKTADTWNSQGTVAGGATTTYDPYREWSGTIVRIDTTESTGKTVLYCQMDQMFLDSYYTTSATKAAFSAGVTDISLSHLPSIGAKIYWDNPHRVAGTTTPNAGFDTLVFEGAPSSSVFTGLTIHKVIPVGSIVTMYKCYQPVRFVTPLQSDTAFTTSSSPTSRANLSPGNNGPTPTGFDTATAHSWEVIGVDASYNNGTDTNNWAATMRKTIDGENISQPGRYKGTGANSYRTDFWAEQADPIFVTRNLAYTLFGEVPADAVNSTGFDVYVATVKGDANNSGQSFRRITGQAKVTGDGASTEFKVYFSGERFSPGIGTWSRKTSTPVNEKRVDPYSINVQVTGTTVASTNANYGKFLRPYTPGNQRSSTNDLTGLLQKIYQSASYFTLKFDSPLPTGAEVSFDYCIESMDHARVTPNGDPSGVYNGPGADSSTSYTSTAIVAGDFVTQWDTDNYKS